jgi:hypothetical protein
MPDLRNNSPSVKIFAVYAEIVRNYLIRVHLRSSAVNYLFFASFRINCWKFSFIEPPRRHRRFAFRFGSTPSTIRSRSLRGFFGFVNSKSLKNKQLTLLCDRIQEFCRNCRKFSFMEPPRRHRRFAFCGG